MNRRTICSLRLLIRLLFIYFLFTSSPAFCQSDSRFELIMDSLIQVVNDGPLESAVIPLTQLHTHVSNSDFELADSIFRELQLIAIQYPNHKDIASIWLLKAGEYNKNNKYDSLKFISQKVLDKEGISDYQRGRALNNLGIYEERIGSLDSALIYYQKSIASSNYESYKLYNNMGRLLIRMSKIGEAIHYFELAMNDAKENGLLNAEAVIANNIGAAYEQIDNINKAVAYYKRSLEIKNQLNDDKGKLYALYNLALVSSRMDVGQKYQEQGLALAQKIDNQTFIELFKSHEASRLIEQSKFDEAEAILLPLYNEIKGNPGEYNMSIEYSLAKLYIAKEEFDKAEKYLDNFKDYAVRINSKAELHNIRPLYLEIYSAQNKYKDYAEVAAKYYPYEDSIKSELSLKKFIELEGKLDDEQKEKINLLNKSITEKEKSKLRLGLIGLLIVTILLLLLYLRNRRVVHQRKVIESEKLNAQISGELYEKLAELDHQKSIFFTNVTHELRTPLTLILGPIEQLKSKTDDPTNLSLLNMIQKNARRQLTLVNQLLDLSKIDADRVEIRMSKTDMVIYIQNVMHSFENLATSKDINLSFSSMDKEIEVYFDSVMMEKILYNLLSNALKYTPNNGEVKVRIWRDNGSVHLDVMDNGPGIPINKVNRVFDRFYQIENQESLTVQGTGVGLALTKELVELQHGNISMKSDEGLGTTVHLTFVLGREHLKDEEIVKSVNTQKYDSSIDHRSFTDVNLIDVPKIESYDKEPYDKEGYENKPTIVVVEDNSNVRAFLMQVLSEKYKVYSATNGKEGIAAAQEKSPDLIISDVMMPVMGGFEMCEAIKKDVITSHIPVILLTAKASHDEKLAGLETGADAYIFKPFDPREILIRVENIISDRLLLRTKFASAITVSPSEITTNSVDQDFLTSALKIVEENIANESFRIEDLASSLNMSKPNLNRKLRALVDKSTNKFIQSIRLQRAKNLLEQKAGNVTEVAYMVGFSSPSYFVKCYKDLFDETPGNV